MSASLSTDDISMIQKPDLKKSGRRLSPRIDAAMRLEVSFGQEATDLRRIHGLMKNASARGFACTLDAPVPGTVDTVKAWIRADTQDVEIACQIRWRTEDNQYGLCFTETRADWWPLIQHLRAKFHWPDSPERRGNRPGTGT